MIRVVVLCNGLGGEACAQRFDGNHKSARSARLHARSLGWRMVRRGLDQCPSCVEKVKLAHEVWLEAPPEARGGYF